MINDMLEEQIGEEENLSEDTFQDLRRVLQNKRLLVEAFKMWDAAGKGSIDLADCRRMVMLSEEGGITGDDADDLAEAIMDDVDDNKDGVIDFKEFCYMHYMLKTHRLSSAFAATVKKAEKKFLTREQVTSLRYEDGSTFQGQCTKAGVFEGHGTYEIGKDGSAYTGSFLHGRFHGHGHIW